MKLLSAVFYSFFRLLIGQENKSQDPTSVGIASLTRAFLHAGTPTLDQAPSQLMNPFYDQLDQGIIKDIALRQAELNYKRCQWDGSSSFLVTHYHDWKDSIR